MTRLWETFSRDVAGYFRAQGVRDADDLVNEVFIGVFKRVGRFEGDETQFRRWLFTIAHHRLVDERRKWARRPEESLPFAMEEQGGDTETEALAVLGGASARELIESLAPDQRDVLLLRILADQTIDQIAETLRKRPGAVKALQRRGLAALRKNFEKRGVTL